MTFGHLWLEMAPLEEQSPFHFLNTSVNKQILILDSPYYIPVKKTGPILRKFNLL